MNRQRQQDAARRRWTARVAVSLLLGMLGLGPLLSVSPTDAYPGSVLNQSGVTLSASPPSIGPGEIVTATWSGLSTPASDDWLGLYVPGTADNQYLAWRYTTGTASGSVGFQLPSNLTPGTYELRLQSQSVGRLATSNTFTLPSLLVTVASAAPGSEVPATWSGITNPASTDWLGLYVPGTADDQYLAWRYTTGGGSGSVGFQLPATLALGTYELRLFSNSTALRLALSNAFTVATTLAASPPLHVPGAIVNATWKGIPNPSATDWLALYTPGAADNQYVNWILTTGAASGTVGFPLPSTLAAGLYELRLQSQSVGRLATSNAITVAVTSSDPNVLLDPNLVQFRGASRFLLGYNFPWNQQNYDFSSESNITTFGTPIARQLATMTTSGTRVVRYWVFGGTCNYPSFNADGSTIPLTQTPAFSQQFRALLTTAQQQGVYIVPVLLDAQALGNIDTEDSSYICSFNNPNSPGRINANAATRVPIISNPTLTKSYLDNAVAPLLLEFGNHEAIITWSIINEPDDITQGVNAQPTKRATVTKANMDGFIRTNADFMRQFTNRDITFDATKLTFLTKWQGLPLNSQFVHWYLDDNIDFTDSNPRTSTTLACSGNRSRFPLPGAPSARAVTRLAQGRRGSISAKSRGKSRAPQRRRQSSARPASDFRTPVTPLTPGILGPIVIAEFPILDTRTTQTPEARRDFTRTPQPLGQYLTDFRNNGYAGGLAWCHSYVPPERTEPNEFADEACNPSSYLTSLPTMAAWAAAAPQNTSVAIPRPVACTPRPNVSVGVAPIAGGRLRVTVTAQGLNNTISSITINQAKTINARVDIGGFVNDTSPRTVPIDAAQTTFDVQRLTPNQATTETFVVTDACGNWPTFVGGGPSAF